MEQGDVLHSQHPEWPALDRALWGGPHPEHEGQLLSLQDHLLQGGHAPLPLRATLLPPAPHGSRWGKRREHLPKQPAPTSPHPTQAKYWSSNIHEVQGAVFSRSGRVLHRLFGKWNEGLYRGPLPGGQCIWKPSKWGDGGGLGRVRAAMEVHLPQPLPSRQTPCPQTTSETSASPSLPWS